MIKLICVDLDGTLFDTVRVNAASYRAALEEQGFTLSDELYAARGNGRYYKEFLPEVLGEASSTALIERIHDRKKALYSSCLGAARRNEALFALLEAMRPAARLALVTTANRRNTAEILEKFGCAGLFDLILTSEDITRSKPDPEGYLRAMAHFGVCGAETVIFEDSEVGLQAARAAGAAVFRADRF